MLSFAQECFKLVICAANSLYAVSFGNHGCSGGTIENTFMYIIENGGVDLDKYYPFKARVRKK